jgi:RTX calcium-binding nonapeptide repeat (4 copies)
MVTRKLIISLLAAGALAPAATAVANTSHDGWPRIDGMLLMNKDDGDRPLDARPGHAPFGGQDDTYSCDAEHLRGSCQAHFVNADGSAPVAVGRPGGRRGADDAAAPAAGLVVKNERRHNELLGGHGDDQLFAGPAGDVLWGDYKPSGQPTSQVDLIVGGAGRDFVYASHGRNTIRAGAGNDWLKAHYGRGTIDCGPGRDVLYVSRKAQKHYRITGCETISHKTLGY